MTTSGFHRQGNDVLFLFGSEARVQFIFARCDNTQRLQTKNQPVSGRLFVRKLQKLPAQ